MSLADPHSWSNAYSAANVTMILMITVGRRRLQRGNYAGH